MFEDEYWEATLDLGHRLKTRLGVNIFKKSPCLFATRPGESANDPVWERIVTEGKIFTYMDVISSQGHLYPMEVMVEIANLRDGLGRGFYKISLEDLYDALKKSAWGIVRFWRQEDVRGYEYPLTRVWREFGRNGKPENKLISLLQNEIPDDSQSRFIRLHSQKLRCLGREGGFLTIPEGIVFGSILPFLEPELSPEWELVREGFEAHPIILRNAQFFRRQCYDRMYSLKEISNQAIVASLTKTTEERNAYTIAANALLQTVREWDSIEGGLIDQIDDLAIKEFTKCYEYFLGICRFRYTNTRLLEGLDSYLEALHEIRGAVRRRVPLDRFPFSF